MRYLPFGKDAGVLKQLVDYTIRTDFPHLGEPSPTVYLQWFREVCLRTAEMIVQWMRVGFVHGVMNTDNMSILGLTIDYGPYGWLENFDPNWTPNTTDAGRRRYRFGNQPDIAHWNLGQFAESILPLVRDVEPLQDALNGYTTDFQAGWQAMMARKLGWRRFEPDTDAELVSELLAILELVETDMTLFHRRLTQVDVHSAVVTDTLLIEPLMDAYYVPDQLTADYRARLGAWIRSYRDRVRKDAMPHDERNRRMNAVNPKYVPAKTTLPNWPSTGPSRETTRWFMNYWSCCGIHTANNPSTKHLAAKTSGLGTTPRGLLNAVLQFLGNEDGPRVGGRWFS